MPVHILERTQIVHATLEECWSFFSDPRNLERITPPELGFQILTQLPHRIHPGMMIKYRVHPLFGIPMTWVTEITQACEPHYFADEQRVGPYALWHHEHFFEAVEDGTVRMRDLVHYSLPFGIFGDIAHVPVVLPRLNRIFDFRVQAVDRLFPAKK